MKKYTQIPLPVRIKTNANFHDFLGEKNQFVIQTLQDENQTLIYLNGKKSSGKTFLLHAACESQQNSIYLSIKEVLHLNPNLTDNLEQFDLIAIDDVELLKNAAHWQEAIFSLYNRLVANQKKLIVASALLPNQLENIIQDLRSRFSAMLLLNLQDLTDEEKIEYFIKRADLRGIFISADVATFIVTHYPRDLSHLNEVLDQLDKASLSAKRKITLPFVKTVLAEMKD